MWCRIDNVWRVVVNQVMPDHIERLQCWRVLLVKEVEIADMCVGFLHFG